ncbi:Alpha/Beta hydrolase protein [Phaeosphaeriaceae sp. PMI808]|nr:Alpha/Beta hydrolase protein [Phaeosphaeriaceae sp. PMI808]
MKLFKTSLWLSSFLITVAQEACDTSCQAAFQKVLATESASWVSANVTLDEFYTTPTNISGATPGALLRWETVSRADINKKFTPPAGTSIARFMYMTEDIDRKPIPATGFVLLPFKKPDPTKPLNTLVYTHGTAGRIRNCAPSNHKDLNSGWSGVYALVQAGYAVVAPDYAGQGSDIPQGFMYEAGFLHAADAAYGLIAARKTLGALLSEEYVVVGHSEGGMSAWRTNERLAMPEQEELLKAGKFLGSVAISPALRPLDLFPESIRLANGGPIRGANPVFILQSLERLFPDTFRMADYVTDMVLGRIPLLDQGCIQVGGALLTLPSEQLFKNVDWIQHPDAVDWQKRYNGAGPHALAAPMLVVQGMADTIVYANNTEIDFVQTCNAYPKSKATLMLYPDSDHFVITQNTQPDFIAWIKDRFNHVEAPEGCQTKTVEPITDTFRDITTTYVGISSS